MNADDFSELRKKTAALPREIRPPRDLWPEIKAGVERLDPKALPSAERPRLLNRHWFPFAAAAAVAVAALVLWPRADRSGPAWAVDAVAGTPRLGARPLTGAGEWRVGQWLETDASSRARFDVGAIGEVRLEPNSRLRLLSAASDNHRLELARGTMSALIWAPPRLFFVETPSATAVDLGCAYTLSVDDAGAGTLHVTSGYVALEHGDRESIIPAGQMCLTRPGAGPGTPFAADAPAALRAALERFDFQAGGATALATVLEHTGENDRVTLWHLLSRAPAAQRGAVFDRLAAFSPPPGAVTRGGILAGDAMMRRAWADELGLVPSGLKLTETFRKK